MDLDESGSNTPPAETELLDQFIFPKLPASKRRNSDDDHRLTPESDTYKRYKLEVPILCQEMFEDPSWYSKLSENHRSETKWLLDRQLDRLKWSPGEAVLDVGCGSGDALYHVIRPALSPDYRRIIGVDMSPKMISFARSKWSEPRLDFQVMDISTQEEPLSFFDEDIRRTGGFHKIFSFFCLQWVMDRRRMLENLFSLLRPGGTALLLLVVRSGVYNVWDKMAKSQVWSRYLKDIKLPFNEYIYMDNYDEVFCHDARKVGFNVIDCEILERKNIFTTKTDTDEEKILRLRSVDPMVGGLPDHLKSVYLGELLAMVKEDVSPRGATDYTGLMVRLSKP